tara:strand:- start:183 stop:977 length:795 start_codon:yes stop_codon:yes gene_type:complete
MPELAELRRTADFINDFSNGVKFQNVKKNPIHKCSEVNLPFNKFKIKAISRGKELALVLKDSESDNAINLFMTMGMSGKFAYTDAGNEKKHSHLIFESDCKTSLSFVDVRRFGKWKVGDTWSINRGPDPTIDSESFYNNVIDNLDKASFNHPIHTVLMNQKYFNGIGNYLRAEILYRLPHINPFLPAREVLSNYPEIFHLCKIIPLQAYVLSGGQLRECENPFRREDMPFKKFMRCYGNPQMLKKLDKNKRMFWYDPKWKEINF